MIKLKNLIKEVTANSVAYFAYRTKVKKVEPAIFDSFKRLMKYKENDKFQYFNMNPKKRLGVYQVIKKAVPMSSTKLSSAEKKKYQEEVKKTLLYTRTRRSTNKINNNICFIPYSF